MMGEMLMDPRNVLYLMCREGSCCWSLAGKLRKMGYHCYYIKGGYMSYLEMVTDEIFADETRRKKIQMKAEHSIITKFRKQLWRPFIKAIQDYELIKDGDKIAVCISGGKDSMLMAKLFQELEKHGNKNFEVIYLVMDPGYKDLNRKRIEVNAKLLGLPVTIFESQIFEAVDTVEDSPCYLCARMRRGYLYSKAKELGCNKIALGHHFDDVIETILMGMLYGGQVQTMMPKLHSIHFEGMELIRPLYYIREEDIIHWRQYNKLYFIACACRVTERGGGVAMDSKRGVVKALIRDLAQDNEFVEKNIFRSVENVNLATVISYKDEGKVHHFLDDYDVKGESGFSRVDNDES
ncbi:MAG: ATPase [Lachnospiraceae bacterium]|nr:ATPase [Lachnospiraceae bacterium]